MYDAVGFWRSLIISPTLIVPFGLSLFQPHSLYLEYQLQRIRSYLFVSFLWRNYVQKGKPSSQKSLGDKVTQRPALLNPFLSMPVLDPLMMDWTEVREPAKQGVQIPFLSLGLRCPMLEGIVRTGQS